MQKLAGGNKAAFPASKWMPALKIATAREMDTIVNNQIVKTVCLKR